LKKSIASLILFLLFTSACTPASSPTPNGLVNISVSILPQKYFVERIGEDLVNINVMVGPGDSPHTYEPKVNQMKALTDADIYFAIGVEFEKAWMDRIISTNADMEIVDLSERIDKIAVAAHHQKEEGDGSEVEQESDELDPHVWTSPEMVIQMSQRIYEQLAAVDPDNQEIYFENLNHFISDIKALQDDIKSTFAKVDSPKFMVFHPSWGYFAREFGLEQLPIEVDGTEPSPAELIDLIDEAKREDIKVIFAQPEFSTRSAQYIATEIGGEVILVSPLAENWLENMREIASKFKSAQ